MKIDNFLGLFFIGILLIGCSVSKKAVADDNLGNRAESAGAEVAENVGNQDNGMDSSRISESSQEMQINGSSGAMNNVQAGSKGFDSSGYDYDGMFEYVMMTESQKQEFESSMSEFQNKINTTPNGEMLGNIENERERVLEEILSGDQFKAYQKWEAGAVEE